MADKQQPALHFPDHFAYLGEPSSVLPLEVGATFWEDLMGGKLAHLGPGRLVSFASFEADWKMWAMHPEGEELVCLFSGQMDFVLDETDGPKRIALREAGDFLIVPRGAWHTARVHVPSRALFITAGEGTQHRAA